MLAKEDTGSMGSENQAAKVIDASDLRMYLAEELENIAPPRDWGRNERKRIAASMVDALRRSGRRWSL